MQTAVAQALTVLEEFYAKAAEAAALSEQQPVIPEIFDKPCKGMLSASGGARDTPKVIESSLARLRAEPRPRRQLKCKV